MCVPRFGMGSECRRCVYLFGGLYVRSVNPSADCALPFSDDGVIGLRGGVLCSWIVKGSALCFCAHLLCRGCGGYVHVENCVCVLLCRVYV